MMRLALLAILAVVPSAPRAQEASGAKPVVWGSIHGIVRDEITRRGVVGAEVRLPALGRSTRSDSGGRFTLDSIPEGYWPLRLAASYFQAQEVTVRVTRAPVQLDVLLGRLQQLPRVKVLAPGEDSTGARHAHRLFDTVVLPAVTTLAARQIRDMPTLVEPDVIRSLQSLPGGVVLNDLNAQLYVRGGAPDQNLILLDGAPVFGAYHMFGMAGVFNPDAVERVEFQRGLQAARYGGALSSVIDIAQRDGGEASFAEAGLSFTSLRLSGGGRGAGDRVGWMAAGRRTHVDAFIGTDMPMAYRDAQTRITFAPDSSNRFALSAFTSSDRFGFGTNDPQVLQSGWTNAVASLGWKRSAEHWNTSMNLWGSGFDARIDVHGDISTNRTASAVRNVGVRAESERALAGGLWRAGADLQHFKVRLSGSEIPGGYFFGSIDQSYALPALYTEWDRAFGRFRLAPGLRASYRSGLREPLLLEPRVGVRATITPSTAFSVGLSRSYQYMSTLRDERRVLPGPSIWFAHPDGAPASQSDAVTAELEIWRGMTWQLTAGAYLKQFSDVAHWRPVAVRDLASVSYDDGSARGLELSLRRYGDRVNGWVGYTLSRTQFTDAITGARYDAPWDRRHAANAALSVRVRSRLHLSAQGNYGTGHPFWPFLGDVVAPHFQPFEGTLESTRTVPLWGPDQQRHEPYVRLDLGMRTSFGVRDATVEPYLNLQNVAGRPNVLYYEAKSAYGPGPNGPVRLDAVLRPIAMPAVMLPTLGFNIRF